MVLCQLNVVYKSSVPVHLASTMRRVLWLPEFARYDVLDREGLPSLGTSLRLMFS